MPCAGCQKRRAERERISASLEDLKTLGASDDVFVIADGAIRKLRAAEWNLDTIKLLVFVPESFTPVCASEIGALQFWYERFAELGCEVIVCCPDGPQKIAEWYSSEESLSAFKGRTFSSFMLPLSLGLIDDGRCRRASVFVMPDGEMVRQEHFDKVGRSFEELHRMLYAYTTDSYCAEGWKSPAGGFLTKDNG